MISFESLLTFTAAASVLAIIPGPGILFVLAQTAKGGRNAGLNSALGTAIGGLFHVLAGAVGLSALVYSSATVFETVKTLGAIYLFFLSIKVLRETTDFSFEAVETIKFEAESIRQGVLTEALNPKTALFFLALIPQFIPREGSLVLHFLLLGSISVALNTLVDLAVVIFAHRLLLRLRRSPVAGRSFRYLSASCYLGLGFLALRANRRV